MGVTLNGDQPGDVQIKDNKIFGCLVKFFTGLDRVALGESYMDGHWDVKDDNLVAFFEKALTSEYAFRKGPIMLSNFLHSFSLLTFNLQSKSRCKKDIHSHYDLGNDLFKLMLDRSMNYSCGYWYKNVVLSPSANSLLPSGQATNTICETVDEAQMNKMLLIARKLHLQPGMRILDIGCGWGYLAKFLATNFDVHVTGVTISKEQFDYACTTDLESHELEFLRVPGLKPDGSGQFEFKLQDYRDVNDKFDRIVSVGMLEHVGKANYETYFKIIQKNLKDDGLVLIQTIGIAQDYVPQVEPWANKYIFPGGMAPYPDQFVKATFGKFIIEDWHNLGQNYGRTLHAWNENFQKNWPKLADKYDIRFKRMWTYFLLCSEALFNLRKLNNWQVVLSKDGYKGGYISFR